MLGFFVEIIEPIPNKGGGAYGHEHFRAERIFCGFGNVVAKGDGGVLFVLFRCRCV